MKMKTRFNIGRLKLRSASPTLLLGIGIVSTVAGVVVACRQTTKLDQVKARHAERLEKLHAEIEEDEVELINPVDETEVAEIEKKDIRKNTAIAYIKTGIDYARLYAPAAGLVLLGLTSFLVSHRILNKRYLGALALYNSESAAFRRYRKNVVESEGKDKDIQYLTGQKAEKKTIERLTVDENGNEVAEKAQCLIVDKDGVPIEIGPMGKIFARGLSDQWSKNEYYNRSFFAGQQDIFNIMLHDEGVVEFNLILSALGLPKEENALALGYVDDGETEILIDYHERWVPDEKGGYEPMYILDFPGLDVIAGKIDTYAKNIHGLSSI